MQYVRRAAAGQPGTTKGETMHRAQVEELLYQALETEIGGVEVYRNAVACAQNDELKEEWEKYGRQTQEHERILRGVVEKLGLDPEKQTSGRRIVREKGKSLVAVMEMARRGGDEGAAQIVAAECVVDAETKDHMNWQLIGEVTKKMTGPDKEVLAKAYERVEDEEDEHLYHTKGWTRELWLESLGLPAELPPPEEEKDVKSAMEEARVVEQRKGKESGKDRSRSRSSGGSKSQSSKRSNSQSGSRNTSKSKSRQAKKK